MLTLNGRVLRVDRFPNHEARFKDFDDKIEAGYNILELKYETDEDLLALMFAKKHIDEFENTKCTLFIWYMPYSRMDRKIEGDLFTLKYICEYINDLGFKKIVIMEPHSEKTLLMLKNAVAVYPINDWIDYVQKDIGFTQQDSIVLPDKGAVARYLEHVEEEQVVLIEKQRNPITCSIEKMYLKEGVVHPGANCIILDDLCSRGGTALWAAKILKEHGAGNVYVAVSHLEEAALEGNLLKEDSPVTMLYATKSITSKPHPKVKYVDVNIWNYIT